MEQNNSCNSVYGEIIEISEEFVPISYQWWKDNRIMPALSKNRILGPSGRLILQMTHKNSKGTSASEVGQVPEETIPEELHLEPGNGFRSDPKRR
ncbi:MAG: hypothetical protein QMD46_14070 [Methanomicrobiales archaeon]|nr:hypothetical protein [Methanomicrobiales archaeon]